MPEIHCAHVLDVTDHGLGAILRHNADLTVAMKNVSLEEAPHCGIALIDGEKKIRDWEEKPVRPKNTLASMGIYLFRLAFLERMLAERSGDDFGYHVVQDAVKRHRVFAFTFNGYWADVGTLKNYWQSNMDIVKSKRCLRAWNRQVDQGLQDDRKADPPRVNVRSAKIENSLVAKGCKIDGTVIRSVLFPGVYVASGARVVDSVVMHDSVIDSGATTYRAIIDKRVYIGPGSSVGFGRDARPNIRHPKHLFSGLTLIGEDAIIPANSHFAANSIISGSVSRDQFDSHTSDTGAYIEGV